MRTCWHQAYISFGPATFCGPVVIIVQKWQYLFFTVSALLPHFLNIAAVTCLCSAYLGLGLFFLLR